MICLAANTATTVLSVALMRDDAELYFFSTGETRDQGNILLQNIDKALTQNGLSYADIDLLAVCTGPGSFTGIRIGLAAMRAIALAAKKPITGVSSFDLFAAGDMPHVVAVESWRDELYFQTSGGQAVNLTPEDFAAGYGEGKGIVISGDAGDKLLPFMNGASLFPRQQDARDLARIATRREITADKPIPYYLRSADVSVSKQQYRRIET